ncbi:MAG TPA: hypothetical protein VK463_15385 [Desulfomonilaceae bacterium]|nr:hypothetical protein [Desulfomonilaceae bacterium]
MIHLVEQILELVGTLIGYVLNWPFLLVVFLVWLVSRFRVQIGSMLDRRSSVAAGELSKKIQEALDPLAARVGTLISQVSDLQLQMRKVEDVQSIERQNRAMQPLVEKIEALEKGISQIQNNVATFSIRDVPQQLQAALDPIQAHMKTFGDSLAEFEERIQKAASGAELEDVRIRTDGLLDKVGTLADSLMRIDELVGNAVSSADLERVKSEIGRTGRDVQEMGVILASLKTSIESSPWKDYVGEVRSHLNQDLEKLFVSFDSLQAQVKTCTPGSVTAKLQEDLTAVSSHLATVKGDLESLSGRVEILPKEPKQPTADSKKLAQEIKDLKDAVRQLQAPQPVGETEAKPRKRGKSATTRTA